MSVLISDRQWKKPGPGSGQTSRVVAEDGAFGAAEDAGAAAPAAGEAADTIPGASPSDPTASRIPHRILTAGLAPTETSGFIGYQTPSPRGTARSCGRALPTRVLGLPGASTAADSQAPLDSPDRGGTKNEPRLVGSSSAGRGLSIAPTVAILRPPQAGHPGFGAAGRIVVRAGTYRARSGTGGTCRTRLAPLGVDSAATSRPRPRPRRPTTGKPSECRGMSSRRRRRPAPSAVRRAGSRTRRVRLRGRRGSPSSSPAG